MSFLLPCRWYTHYHHHLYYYNTDNVHWLFYYIQPHIPSLNVVVVALTTLHWCRWCALLVAADVSELSIVDHFKPKAFLYQPVHHCDMGRGERVGNRADGSNIGHAAEEKKNKQVSARRALL